jgi:hypothetical protein
MRIVSQPDPAVIQERLDHRRRRPGPPLGLPMAIQIGPDRLAVMAQVPGDGRDRPALLTQRMSFHIVLPGENRMPPIKITVINTETLTGDDRPTRDTAPDDQLTWGNSPSRTGEIQLAPSGLPCLFRWSTGNGAICQWTRSVGRRRELAEVSEPLSASRLVTLNGIDGVGMTGSMPRCYCSRRPDPLPTMAPRERRGPERMPHLRTRMGHRAH